MTITIINEDGELIDLKCRQVDIYRPDTKKIEIVGDRVCIKG